MASNNKGKALNKSVINPITVCESSSCKLPGLVAFTLRKRPYGVVSFSIYKCIFTLMRSLNSYVLQSNFGLNPDLFRIEIEVCLGLNYQSYADFITSGYFPGSPVSTTFLFSFDLLRLWRYLKYLTLGTSEYKFLETIMAISADLGRRGTMNKKLFIKASKLYEYYNSLLDEKKGKAWFGDKLIVSSENAKKVKDEINLFLAAREVSTKYKKLEATGIVMASCGHDVVHTAVEMLLINDVICQYWDFARNIGFLLPKNKYLTENMSPFLSYLHGQAHGCSIFWPLEGRRMYVVRGRNRTRFFDLWTIPKFNQMHERRKTAWTKKKDQFYFSEKVVLFGRVLFRWVLFRWVLFRRAVAGLKFYTARFQMLLDANQLTEEDLPSIQEELIKEAFEYKSGSRRKTTTDISTLQDELEWLHYEWINVKNSVSAIAEGWKWRTKLRRKQGTLYLITKTRPKTAKFVNQDLEETPLELITIEHFEEGIFPWKPASLRPYKEKFKLVDCWQKRNRNKEQIELSFLEMKDVVAEEVPQFLDDEEDDDEIQEDDDEMEEEEDEMEEEEDEMQEDEAEGSLCVLFY
ncbi:hypothetical protein GHT06_016970 [Daphnia sinensis]|uniref:CxC3 like cysteine cluster domain-containing protein n=1 Tax=Daphnia sinensis TaxID=1820382 RepID=A0AAD5LGE9_9CRUS|nr:hypothetical protein GHT06_016970 [Daphnia sinensis]